MTKRLNILFLLAAILLLAACSHNTNTAGSRWWQAFNTRYNVYFNGNQAFIEGMQAKEKGNQDDYTQRLPVFMVGNKKSADLGKSNFETTVEKMTKAIQLHSIKKKPTFSGNTRTPKQKEYMKRKEYNPQLKKAWLLMGQAQFEKGEFLEAAATFSFITRHYAAEPEVATEARIWLARCYSHEDWYYDAEDALNRASRDSLSKRLDREYDATQADLLLRQNRFEEALPYLERTVKNTKSRKQKARRYFLLAQVQHALGKDREAYKSYGRCIAQSPAYEVQFNARIRQTEVATDRDAKSMISKLKRMARNDNNKDYLDQVYYAMGNIYLAQKDTANAVSAYEKGRRDATRSGIEKGILSLRLGELYWDMRQFDKAQPCYSEAISLLPKDREDYQNIMTRSKVLDELVPHTSAVHLQDSLQALAKMSPADRNAAIDRTIAALKQKEAEQKKLAKDSAARERAAANGNDPRAENDRKPTMETGDKSWYFYNPTLVSRGKQDFKKQWGNRKNEDDWQRSNKTVVADAGGGYDYDADDKRQAMRDSLLALGVPEDSIDIRLNGEDNVEEKADTAKLDPHTREYYMAEIPFTAEQVEASNLIIEDGLYNAGIIEKDQLEDFPLAEETLQRLVRQYPDFKNREDALYQLFLMYSRWQKPDKAQYCKSLMASEFPESPMTRMITDPDFELIARYGLEMEDSLYTETYQAYRNRQHNQVNNNYAISTNRFPTGQNRPKFIFVHALNNLGTLPTDTIANELRGLLKDYPKSDVSEMAGMIVKGLESGRKIGDGTFDLGSLWSLRDSDAAKGAENLKGREFTADRAVPYVFIMAYAKDSLNDDQLLYDMAHFNFNTFMMRGFDLSFEKTKQVTQLRVGGFNSFDETHAYAQRLYEDAAMREHLKHCRVLIISTQNLELLGTLYSYDDYKKFYEKHFAPLKIEQRLQTLDEPELRTTYEDEVGPEKPSENEEGEGPETFDDKTESFDDNIEVVKEKEKEKEIEPVEDVQQPKEEEQTEVNQEQPVEEPVKPSEEPVTPTEPVQPTPPAVPEDIYEDTPPTPGTEDIILEEDTPKKKDEPEDYYDVE